VTIAAIVCFFGIPRVVFFSIPAVAQYSSGMGTTGHANGQSSAATTGALAGSVPSGPATQAAADLAQFARFSPLNRCQVIAHSLSDGIAQR
jgi:hypothetical protein